MRGVICEGGVGEMRTKSLREIELRKERDGEMHVVQWAVLKECHCGRNNYFHCFLFCVVVVSFFPPLQTLCVISQKL